jgi:hypothetical protein
MEDDLNFLTKWKTTSFFFEKWKTTSMFWQNGRRPQYFGKMEDNLNSKINGRQPQFSVKGKTTSTILQIEDSINLVANGR